MRNSSFLKQPKKVRWHVYHKQYYQFYEDIAQIAPPLNIVGYTYNSGDSVYDLGTYSRYNYTPQQQIFFDNQMVGDTAKVFIETIFRDDVKVNKEFKIIFDEFDQNNG